MKSSRERTTERQHSREHVRRTESDKRDAEFFRERKARDAANQEKTRRLRALRLAHEAELAKNPPPAPPPKKPAAKRKAKAAVTPG